MKGLKNNFEDYGIRIARENGIPLSVFEEYGFPPAIQYSARF